MVFEVQKDGLQMEVRIGYVISSLCPAERTLTSAPGRKTDSVDARAWSQQKVVNDNTPMHLKIPLALQIKLQDIIFEDKTWLAIKFTNK